MNDPNVLAAGNIVGVDPVGNAGGWDIVVSCDRGSMPDDLADLVGRRVHVNQATCTPDSHASLTGEAWRATARPKGSWQVDELGGISTVDTMGHPVEDAMPLDVRLRLEALRLAVQRLGDRNGDAIAKADKYLAFIEGN